MEKLELEKLVNVIKNKKQIENKTKEINFSTSKNKSNMKSKLRKNHPSKYSIEIRRANKKSASKQKKQNLRNPNLQKRSRRDQSEDDNLYEFLKVDMKNSNK